MLKKPIIIVSLALVFSSCGSSKHIAHNDTDGRSSEIQQKEAVSSKGNKKVASTGVMMGNAIASPASARTASNIITTALSFEGTRYKYGGMDKKGMDCSGLVYTSFKSENIDLPRISRDMARLGERIPLSEIAKGDLIFFITGNKKKTINHVGLVVATDNGSIKFIHSTTSLGVIISSMEESYWKEAFIEVRRII